MGLYFNPNEEPLAPDNMLATDIPVGGDPALRRNRSYFVWERGKPPDVAIEIVSDRRGREEDFKLEQYARIGVPYYVIFDPLDQLHHGVLRCFANHAGEYQPLTEAWFPRIRLGLMLWDGEYEGHHARWLRWCDAQRHVIVAGPELAVQARQAINQERQRADEERQRAEQLAAKLRALGIDPQQPLCETPHPCWRIVRGTVCVLGSLSTPTRTPDTMPARSVVAQPWRFLDQFPRSSALSGSQRPQCFGAASRACRHPSERP